MNTYLKKIISIISVYLFVVNSVCAGVIISSVMPNTLDDADLEYIELYNSGSTGKSLSGYIFEDLSGKQFEFSTGDFLDSFEYKKFYRSDTKIILNNSNEELFLYDDLGILVDNIDYEKSEKNVLISKIIEFTGSIEIGTGEILESSGSVEIGTGEILESSGNVEMGTGEILESSGSVEIGTGEILESSGNVEMGTGEILESSGSVEIGTGEILESSGNVEMGTGEILESSGSVEMGTGEILESSGSVEIGTGEILESSGSVEMGTGEIIESSGSVEQNLSNEEIEVEEEEELEKIEEKIEENIEENIENEIEKIYIKSPEIIIQSGLDDNHNCKKEDCKVNFNYQLENSNFACEWDFGEGEFTTANTETKCNPGYVYYSFGDFKIELKVYQKDLPSNYKKTYLYFSNEEIIEEEEIINEDNDNKEDIKNESQKEEKIEKNLENQKENSNSNSNSNSQIFGVGVVKNNDKLVDFNKEIIDEDNNYKNLKGNGGKFIVKNEEGESIILNNEEYYDYVKEKFLIYYRKLEKGLKIYGKILPNTKIKLRFKEKEKTSLLNFVIPKTNADFIYETTSDEDGNYEFLLTEIGTGDFDIDSIIYDNYGNDIVLEKIKNVNINDEYLVNMQDYVYEKYLEARGVYSDEILINSSSLGTTLKSEGGEVNNIIMSLNEKKWEKLIPKIKIQGKIGNNKELIDDTLYCYENCSVNFDGSSSEGDIDNYFWDFGNGEIFEGSNPGYVKYENYGEYLVNLKVEGNNGEIENEYFYVIYKKEKNNVVGNAGLRSPTENNTGTLKNDLIIDNIEIENEEFIENNNFFIYFIYILIFVFVIVGILVLLRKEELI